MEAQKPALYVSCVKGSVVERFGFRGQYIGVKRIAPPEGWQWNEDEVVAISEREFARCRREYEQALARKDLLQRTEEEFTAWREKETKDSNDAFADAKAKAEAEAKKVSDAAAKAKADAEAELKAAAEARKSGNKTAAKGA